MYSVKITAREKKICPIWLLNFHSDLSDEILNYSSADRQSYHRFQQIAGHLASRTFRGNEDRQSVTSGITEDVALSRDVGFRYYRHYLLSAATLTYRPPSRQIWQWQSSSNWNKKQTWHNRYNGRTDVAWIFIEFRYLFYISLILSYVCNFITCGIQTINSFSISLLQSNYHSSAYSCIPLLWK